MNEGMVLESITGGELYFHMRMYGGFSKEAARHYLIQLVEGVLHMHRNVYCHRDIKPWNIMLSNDLTEIKVIDFGYATPIDLLER